MRGVPLLGKSNPGLYFSIGRKVPKAHRGGVFLFGGFCGVKATQACTFRLGEKYQKPTGAANLCMRGVAAPDPHILIA